MREVVEKLLELQELELVREESRIVHQADAGSKLPDVEQRIERLREQIPDALLRRFDGHRRTGTAAVREQNGLCKGCMLNVTVGDRNRMRRGEMTWLCPNCGRFLLLSDAGN